MKPIHLVFGLLISVSVIGKGAPCQSAPTPESGDASSGQLISLKECLKLSVANSPRLKIAALEQTRLHYGYREAVGGGLPQLNFSGSWDDFLHLPTSLIPGEFFGRPGEMIPVQFGTNFNISGALDASQMLYNQTWLVALKMARQMMQQNDLATEKTGIEVVYDVAQSYYLAQITMQQIRNMNANLEKIEKAEKIAQSQWEHGLIKKVDLDRIVVQKLNMVTEIERLGVLYQQELAMQKYFMGIDQEKEISLEDSIPTSTLIPGSEGDLNKHIDIRMIEKQKELVNTSIRLDQSGYYPNLTLIGSVNYLNQSNTMYLFGKPADWFNTSLVGLRLSVPVFSGMQRHYRVSQSRVELEKLKVSEDDAKRLIRINSGDAARKLINSIEAEKRQRENMGLAGRVYNISQEQYQKGVIPLTDLLTAETALSDAQANHTYALVQMKISELNYLKANGRLMEITE